ncbi:MAG: glycosyl hydrolase, partial [Caldilineaceae bacterium]|nr:glycosyl hydrolase [Caldilineaceae bacterium]
GLIGKVGLSASPAKAGRVWALIESQEEPGIYRSDDFGETWSKLSAKQDLRYRPWYYMHVYADPVDAETVYVCNLGFWKSLDGGKNWDAIPTPHGDNHGLWIDPKNHQRMIQSNDGGANVSFNGGTTFSTIYNQLTAQFYNICTDNQFPYRVYGTQQDNSSISVPSNTIEGIIPWGDCYMAGTGESGYIAVHPEDSNIVYVGAVGSSPGGGGALQRYDHRTGHIQLVNVNPEPHGGLGAGDLEIRFPWTFPILFSPHDPNVLYTAGNQVFRTTDEGLSWEAISPDLTRNDPDKLKASGGPITKDTSGAEHYCTIYTLRESIHEPGVFWAGSDDGLVHLSRDGGQNWANVTPPDLPEWSYIRT